MAGEIDLAATLPLLSDPNPKTRRQALKTLRSSTDVATISAVAQLAATETDQKALTAAVDLLAEADALEGVSSALARALDSGLLPKLAQGRCARALANHPDDPAAADALIRALKTGAGWLRSDAAVALASFAAPAAAEAVSHGFRSGQIKPPTKAGASVAVARTIDLFVGDDAVREEFSRRLQPEDTILIALRVGLIRGLEGGLVATDDRLIVALRQAGRLGLPKTVNKAAEYPYPEISEAGYTGSGFSFRSGSDTVSFANLQTWLWDQWRPHVARIRERIPTWPQPRS